MTKLARTPEQWRTLDPGAVACRGPDDCKAALVDARHDILALAEVLHTLHTVCVGMDCENQMRRPTEASYQRAMKAAAALLAP